MMIILLICTFFYPVYGKISSSKASSANSAYSGDTEDAIQYENTVGSELTNLATQAALAIGEEFYLLVIAGAIALFYLYNVGYICNWIHEHPTPLDRSQTIRKAFDPNVEEVYADHQKILTLLWPKGDKATLYSHVPGIVGKPSLYRSMPGSVKDP